jgi:hypothetical protein
MLPKSIIFLVGCLEFLKPSIVRLIDFDLEIVDHLNNENILGSL